VARFSDMLGGDDPNESAESTDSAQPDDAATDHAATDHAATDHAATDHAATDGTPATEDATATGDAGEQTASADEDSADVWAPDAPLDVPSPEEPEAPAHGVDDAAATDTDANTATEEPAPASPRATFSELAREQAARAEEEDADTDRVRELGLDSLPRIDDDLLPGH
jgi:hypothetical protein